ncbi:MAG: hypothetical protein LV468_02260 [Candidatus Nitrosotenuis sp.]|jgi:hypothetical protein|uniref:hypothetical protein n=1 Tax=Candidatus Nitrosotenuis cloacae TaxID=1603555 RepID=UPI0022829C7A|nr:hypothetical protein [Candidatus Nitrosotenuis cloacae]MDC8437808.1 hypothetical protein [Candidatus Nitrosotenuis sp.]
MKKRGIIVCITGVSMVVASFAIAVSILQQNGLEGDFSLPDLLDGMFDQTSENTMIASGDSASFSFDATDGTTHLLWGLQILDYQSNDAVAVSISNIYGDNFGSFASNQPAFFETLDIEKSDILNFNVENKGPRTITVVMMFTKNPEDSDKLADPNSPLNQMLVPLAAVAFLLIIGIIVIIAGTVIAIIDYKKRHNSEYV